MVIHSISVFPGSYHVQARHDAVKVIPSQVHEGSSSNKFPLSKKYKNNTTLLSIQEVTMSRPVMTPYRSFQARSMKAPAKHQALHSSAEMIPLASKPTLYSTSVSDRPAPTSIKDVFVNQHQALPSRAEMIP